MVESWDGVVLMPVVALPVAELSWGFFSALVLSDYVLSFSLTDM